MREGGDPKRINAKEARKVSQGNCICFCKAFKFPLATIITKISYNSKGIRV